MSGRSRFIIGASALGTLIEWYDFYIYGVLAVFFSQHFFPPGNENWRCSRASVFSGPASSCARSARWCSGTSAT